MSHTHHIVMTEAGVAITVFACIALAILASKIKVTAKVASSKQNYVKPRRSHYDGWFVNTNKCKDCGIIGADEDLRISNPCIKCGGTIQVDKPRIWNNVDFSWKTRKEVQEDINFTSSH